VSEGRDREMSPELLTRRQDAIKELRAVWGRVFPDLPLLKEKEDEVLNGVLEAEAYKLERAAESVPDCDRSAYLMVAAAHRSMILRPLNPSGSPAQERTER
jgi:hypothetical protein